MLFDLNVFISLINIECVCVCVCVCVLSRVQLFTTPWTAAYQDALSMEFSRQEYWSGLPFPTPGNLSDPGIKPTSLRSPELADRFFTTVPPEKILLQGLFLTQGSGIVDSYM